MVQACLVPLGVIVATSALVSVEILYDYRMKNFRRSTRMLEDMLRSRSMNTALHNQI